jgi:hypothetical protein
VLLVIRTGWISIGSSSSPSSVPSPHEPMKNDDSRPPTQSGSGKGSNHGWRMNGPTTSGRGVDF